MSIKRSRGNSSKLARIARKFYSIIRSLTHKAVLNKRRVFFTVDLANNRTLEIYTNKSQLPGAIIVQGIVRCRVLLSTGTKVVNTKHKRKVKFSYFVQILQY